MQRSTAFTVGGLIGMVCGMTVTISGYIIGANIALPQVEVLTDMLTIAVNNATEICVNSTIVQAAVTEANTSIVNGAATSFAMSMGGTLISVVGATFFGTGINSNNSGNNNQNNIQTTENTPIITI